MSNDFLDEMKKEFLDEVSHSLEDCEEAFLQLENSENPAEDLARIFRLAHSIKGGGAVVGFEDLSAFAHVVEDLLSFLRLYPQTVDKSIVSLLLKANDEFKTRVGQLKNNPAEKWDVSNLKIELKKRLDDLQTQSQDTQSSQSAADAQGVVAVAEDDSDSSSAEAASEANPKEAAQISRASKAGSTSIKVESDRVDKILNQLEELVVIKSQLMQLPEISETSSQRLKGVVAQVDKTVRELYDSTLSLRMTSLKPLFRKVQRIIRDLSVRLDKPVNLKISGDSTEIDRAMIEMLNDPLIHIARNSVDHGVEKSEVRKKLGKPLQATVVVRAYHEGGRVVIEFVDDGGGINPEKVFAKAVEKGVLPASSKLEDYSTSEIVNLIFAPGFSTAERVSDISGRGVGLDVARSNIEKVGGSIKIQSEYQKGSVFRLEIPLTSAITDGIVTGVNGYRYIVPLPEIVELVSLTEGNVTSIESDNEIVNIRGNVMPLIRLSGVMPVQMAGDEQDLRIENDDDRRRETGVMIIVNRAGGYYALLVDRIFGQNQFVIKNLGDFFESIPGVTGGAIMGNGQVALILDVDGLIRRYRKVEVENAQQGFSISRGAA